MKGENVLLAAACCFLLVTVSGCIYSGIRSGRPEQVVAVTNQAGIVTTETILASAPELVTTETGAAVIKAVETGAGFAEQVIGFLAVMGVPGCAAAAATVGAVQRNKYFGAAANFLGFNWGASRNSNIATA